MTTATRVDADQALREIERRIWNMRQAAFRAYYLQPGDPPAERFVSAEKDDGLKWGRLATLDSVLGIFREVLDGAGGRGHEQMQRQRLRCEGEPRGRLRTGCDGWL